MPSPKKILVTGGSGKAGPWVIADLLEHGYDVVNVDTRPSTQVHTFRADLTDLGQVYGVLEGRDAVIHLAAIPWPGEHAPEVVFRNNVMSTFNILQAASVLGIKKVVMAGSESALGFPFAFRPFNPHYLPIDEAHPLQGQSPYSASKIGADKIAEAFHLSFGVPVVTVRPFNTFGPRQSARAVIPTIITQVLEGKTVRLGSLHPTRDLNYVSNTVDGFLRAAVEPAAAGRTINLGSGREISIGDLAALIGQLMNYPIKIESEEQRVRPGKSEVERLLASHELAASLLHWQPAVSLEEGLRQTIEWVKANRHKYRPNTYTV